MVKMMKVAITLMVTVTMTTMMLVMCGDDGCVCGDGDEKITVETSVRTTRSMRKTKHRM